MLPRLELLRILTACFLLASLGASASAAPHLSVDLATVSTASGGLKRVHGSTGDGSRGVPVAGGIDCDGDGFLDYAMAAMQASPQGRAGAGEIYLIFGDGKVEGTLDTAVAQPDILVIQGDGDSEATGSEIWMDDVTGDGIGDVLIGRQNFTPDAGRVGAGALTILVGGPALRAQAASLQPLDLRTPPAGLTLLTLIGAAEFDRLAIWMRTGDVTGDGTADLLVAADQESEPGESHHGAVYLVRGGSYLAANATIDLANFGSTALAGHLARIRPPPDSAHYHFGATCQIGDLDGNGRSEVFAAAALNRAGAGMLADGAPYGTAHATGGSADGSLYIAWDDNFLANPWPAGFGFDIDASPGSHTIIHGGVLNVDFGEEILAGLDYDADGQTDLFVGDIVGDGTLDQSRFHSGTAHVLYGAGALKGLEFDLDSPPAGLGITTFLGAAPHNIASDTAAHGDFDADGVADLAFSSPHANALGRGEAGVLHVFFGQSGGWPALVDLEPSALPAQSVLRMTEVIGANGTNGSDTGDVLCYSAATGDVDADGHTDLVMNEMLGNGLDPAAEDVGNLIVLSGKGLFGRACGDGFDNDGDGGTDFLDTNGDGISDPPGDPGCRSLVWKFEAPQCDDDVDNDGDGGVDWDGPGPADPQCAGKPWRNSEWSSRGCGIGFELALLLPLLSVVAGRSVRRRLG
jgi:hypothetical protein